LTTSSRAIPLLPAMEKSNGTQGRALLQSAVNAVQDGRWDDLTWLFQSHAPAFQAARLRLEQQALERHAARAASAAAAANIPEPAKPTGIVATAPFASASPVAVQPEDAVAGGVAAPLWEMVDKVVKLADSKPWLSLLVVQVLVIASYAPAFAYQGFIMDDTVAIERNPNVVGEASLTEFLARDFWGLPMHGAGWTNKSFRPLTTLTYHWNYLLHGLQSCGFHVTNVLLHCSASVAVGRAATVVMGLPGFWAALASAFFGVHPVHTENVLYLVGRADVLAAVLGLAALSVYAAIFCRAPTLQLVAGEQLSDQPAPRDPWFQLLGLAPASVLVIASGLCKETGFTLFALMFLMELLDFFAMKGIAARKGNQIPTKVWRRIRLRVCLLFVIIVVSFIARYRQTAGTELNMSPQDNPISFETSRMVRMLSYSYLHGAYIRLLCWPQFLCYDYSLDAIPAVRTAADCRMLLPLAAYMGFLAAVTASFRAPLRYRRAGLLALALLLVPYLPASNILFPVGTVIGERLMYIPSAGFCLAVVVGLHRAYARATRTDSRRYVDAAAGAAVTADGTVGPHRSKKGGRASSREPRRRPEAPATPQRASMVLSLSPRETSRLLTCSVLVCIAMVVLTVRTLLRVRVWESAETLFLYDGHTQPTSSKTQFNLGITHMQRQEWDEAVQALLRCAWADPLSSLPFYRIGQIEILRGRFDAAESFLSAAIDKFGASLMVRDEEVFHDLAVAMFQNGKPDRAEKRLKIALQLNPEFAKGWNNLGCCIASRDLHDASRAVQRAVTLAPENPQYWANLALLARHMRDPSTGAEAWRRAVALWPSMPEPRDCTWEFAPAS